MSAEENREIIRHVFDEVLNRRNVGAIDALFAADVVDHAAWPGQAPGLAGIKQALVELLASFPDLRVTLEAVIADGDLVATRETWRGTHAPTGQEATGTVMHFFRIRDGKVTDDWSRGWDWLEPLMAA